MKTFITFVLLFFVAAPAAAQSIATGPTPRERVDQGLTIGSISMSSIALGLTMSCTTAGTCRELNPVMNKWIGDDEVKAVVIKSAIAGGTTYLVWRTTRGRTRTIALGAMFAFNAWDAIHDVRQMRKIDRR